MAEQLDFVAVGDITTDAFIALKDATVNCEINRDTCMLCVRFGDKIPYESVTVVPAVGNSPNASVSAKRLGLQSALVTNLGDDDYGKEDVERLTKEGVITDYVKTHPGMQSNYHYVLRYEEERTILVKHYEYPYELPAFSTTPKWMYLSSLGENSVPFHHEIAKYVKEHEETRLVFQPGTFQIKLGYDTLRDIYEVTELFFCNKEEARRILKTNQSDVKELLKGVHGLGPRIAVVTDGPNGAYTFDGNEVWHMPMYPDPKPPVDRTGAGDSFASTFTTALVLGKDIPTALSWGPINSMSVVQYIGAQEGLLTRDQLEQFLAEAPQDYKAEKLN
jgi:ribokinase